MGYWREVACRAWRESAKAVKLDSLQLLMVLILGQIIIGFVLYLALGIENLPANLWAGVGTLAAPILLFIPFFPPLYTVFRLGVRHNPTEDPYGSSRRPEPCG